MARSAVVGAALEGSLAVDVLAGDLCLLPDRAAYLPQHGILLIADAHIGKAQAFRQRGVPVPAGTTQRNLQRLTDLIECTEARALVFLGDLLHARASRASAVLETVASWRDRHRSLPMTLVRGNHDGHAGDPPPSWHVDCVDEPWRVGSWALCHHPQTVEGAYVLAGHTHPCHRVGRGSQALRLPAFHVGPSQTVLPAFGEFTGQHPIRTQVGDQVVVVAEGHLRRVL